MAEKSISEFSDGLQFTANPSSVHRAGRRARTLLRSARRNVLRLVVGENSSGAQLVFTSGGTEACNQMVLGFLGPILHLGQFPGHIVVSAIEHPAILETIELLERSGWEISRIAPNSCGVVQAEDFAAAIKKNTALVAVMAANNETGAIQPVAEIAQAVRGQKFFGPIVSDMTQAVGKSEITAAELFAAGVSAVAVSGHKLGAPTGIGALIYSTAGEYCFALQPLLYGGPQEHRLRAGTENLAGATAFGAVAEEIYSKLESELRNRVVLREQLWEAISASTEGVLRLGPGEMQIDGKETLISNTLLLRFADCRGDDLTAALDINGLAVSTGSACASGKQGISPTVAALGLDKEAAREVVRLSIDWNTTAEEIASSAVIIQRCVQQMRFQQNQGQPPAMRGCG